MPEIIKFYEQYKDSNLVFIAISLDDKKQSWLAAIKKYSIPFINVSDLKGWANEPALIYGVSGVPDNFLINTTGKLIVHKRGFNLIKIDLLDLIK